MTRNKSSVNVILSVTSRMKRVRFSDTFEPRNSSAIIEHIIADCCDWFHPSGHRNGQNCQKVLNYTPEQNNQVLSFMARSTPVGPDLSAPLVFALPGYPLGR